MKKIKHLFILLLISSTILQSCSTSEDATDPQKSSALRIFLKEMKSAYNITGRTASDEPDMCFEFVYPLTLSYNDGTTVVVANQNELLAILENETSELYIDGISFPFDILVAGSTVPVTIADEEAFWNAIENCDMDTYDDSISENDCFTFVYPFSLVTNNNQTIVITSESALLNILDDDDNDDNYIVDFVYPFSIIINNETVQVDNAYEFEELIEDCSSSNCNCPDIDAPVCVNIGGETIEFPNACNAECAGFTSADFVDCEDSSVDIDFDDVLENCLNISYPVQVQFNGAVATAQNDSQLLQLYNPSQNQIPAFIYPIIVSFENIPNVTYTVYNQDGMIELILELDCD
jgi:hypothetical protein